MQNTPTCLDLEFVLGNQKDGTCSEQRMINSGDGANKVSYKNRNNLPMWSKMGMTFSHASINSFVSSGLVISMDIKALVSPGKKSFDSFTAW